MSSLSLKESVVTGALWVGLAKWLNQILSFSIYVVLARLVGPASFGLIALAGVYIAFIGVFVNQGFGTALVQRKELDGSHLDTAFWVNLLMATAFALGSFVLSDQLATLLGEPQLDEVLQWLSCVLVLNSFSVIPQAVLVRSISFRALGIRALLATVIGGAVGLLMAWRGLGVWSLVGQQLSGVVVGTVGLWWATSWRPSFNISRRHLRDLYGFSISILGNDLLWFGSQRIDQFLIGVRLGASYLGPYALASRIIELLIDVITAPFAAVTLPAFSRLQDERQRLNKAFYKTTEVIATISIPAFCGVSVLAPNFVPVFFGPQWSTSVPLIQIMAIWGVLRATLCCVHPLMLAIGRPGVYFLLFAFYSALTFGLCLLATWWDVAVVAMAVSLAMGIHSVVFLIVCRMIAGISFRALLQGIKSPVIASGIMIAMVWTLRYLALNQIGDLLFIVMSIPIAIGIYITAMMIMRPQIVKELRWLLVERFKFA